MSVGWNGGVGLSFSDLGGGGVRSSFSAGRMDGDTLSNEGVNVGISM